MGEHIIHAHWYVFVKFQINIEQQAGEYCADQSGSPGLYIAILTHIRKQQVDFCVIAAIFYYGD